MDGRINIAMHRFVRAGPALSTYVAIVAVRPNCTLPIVPGETNLRTPPFAYSLLSVSKEKVAVSLNSTVTQRPINHFIERCVIIYLSSCPQFNPYCIFRYIVVVYLVGGHNIIKKVAAMAGSNNCTITKGCVDMPLGHRFTT